MMTVLLVVIVVELATIAEFLRRQNGISYGSGYTPWSFRIGAFFGWLHDLLFSWKGIG